MYKRLLSYLALAAIAGILNAQQVIRIAQPQKADATDQMNLKYWDEKDTLSTLGAGKAEEFQVAFYEPDMAALKGNQLSAVYFLSQVKSASNIKVWVRSSLTGADLASKTISGIDKDGQYLAMFDTPYTITGEPIFIGYSFTVTGNTEQDYYPIIRNSVKNANGLYMSLSKTLSGGWVEMGSTWGSAIIAGVVTGTSIPQNNVTISAIKTARAVNGQDFTVSTNVTNYGKNNVGSIELKYTIDGVEKTTSVSIDSLKYFGSTQAVNFTQTAPATSGRYQVTSTVTKVNGQNDDVVNGNEQSYKLVTMKSSYPRKTVMEEATGTWSGWSTASIIGIKNLQTAHPDNFIAISVHKSSPNDTDPMYTETYKPISDKYEIFPYCQLDRYYQGDPYYGEVEEGIEHLYQKAVQRPAEAQVTLSSKYADDAQTKIAVTTKVQFTTNDANNHYRMAYALVEDSITGAYADGYVQINNYNKEYYSTVAGYDISQLPADLIPLTQLPREIRDYAFNNVAMGIYDCLGVEGSLTGAIEEGSEKTHNMEITLPKTIQDKSRMRIIALLIDTENGEIINAQQAKVGETVGIKNNSISNFQAEIAVQNKQLVVTAEKAKVEVYTIDGKLISTQNIKGTTVIPTYGYKGTCIVRAGNDNDIMVRKITLY